MIRELILSVLMAVSTAGASASAPASDSVAAPVGSFAVTAGSAASVVLPTNSFVSAYAANDMVIAPDVRCSFAFSPATLYGSRYPGVRQGVGVRHDFICDGDRYLGKPTDVFLFQDIRLTGSGRFWLEAGWRFGVSAGWRKFDSADPIPNTAIGSRTNAILGVGVTAGVRLSAHVALKLAAEGIHYSNGNTSLPNPGVNLAGIWLGVQYDFSDRHEFITRPVASRLFTPHWSCDLTAYGAQRRKIAADGMGENVQLRGSFGVAGLNFAPMYAFSKWFRGGVSLDIQYDESANLEKHRVENSYGEHLSFYRQPFGECLSAGVSLRAELCLPIFSINAGIGRNIIASGADTRIFYQTLALKAYVWDGVFLQAGYQLCNFHEPNNLMLGAGFTFGR